jgi:hypothetical protein
LASHSRLLLVEQLDAVGASLADLRPRAQVLRTAGFDVRTVAIAAGADDDLQHGTTERPQPGIERLEADDAVPSLRRIAETMRADAIVWASAAPGGGERAQALAGTWASWWWPAGWSPARGTHAKRGSGAPLPPVTGDADPGDCCIVDGGSGRPGRLSLWDGPYALVATPLPAGEARALFTAFARATNGRDEVDLVVLDHPDAALEAEARDAGIPQRVHFVGRAPLEAEGAWLQHARAAFAALERPLAAGLVLRALAAGCPLLPIGRAATPVADWLREHGAGWVKPESARTGRDAIAAALERKPAVETAVARGRALAQRRNVEALVAAVAATLGEVRPERRRAA